MELKRFPRDPGSVIFVRPRKAVPSVSSVRCLKVH